MRRNVIRVSIYNIHDAFTTKLEIWFKFNNEMLYRPHHNSEQIADDSMADGVTVVRGRISRKFIRIHSTGVARRIVKLSDPNQMIEIGRRDGKQLIWTRIGSMWFDLNLNLLLIWQVTWNVPANWHCQSVAFSLMATAAIFRLDVDVELDCVSSF